MAYLKEGLPRGPPSTAQQNNGRYQQLTTSSCEQILRLLPTSLSTGAFNEGDSRKLSVHIWYRETRMAGIQSSEGHIMQQRHGLID